MSRKVQTENQPASEPAVSIRSPENDARERMRLLKPTLPNPKIGYAGSKSPLAELLAQSTFSNNGQKDAIEAFERLPPEVPPEAWMALLQEINRSRALRHLTSKQMSLAQEREAVKQMLTDAKAMQHALEDGYWEICAGLDAQTQLRRALARFTWRLRRASRELARVPHKRGDLIARGFVARVAEVLRRFDVPLSASRRGPFFRTLNELLLLSGASVDPAFSAKQYLRDVKNNPDDLAPEYL